MAAAVPALSPHSCLQVTEPERSPDNPELLPDCCASVHSIHAFLSQPLR